jgi:DNA-binding GntR family transcriptional regulator
LCVEEKNFERLFDLDEEFHKTIVVGCGKTRTWGMLQQLNTHYNRIRFLRLAVNYDWENILSEHRAITRAIKEKDPDAAEQAMSEHLSRVIFEKEELLQKYPSFFK